MNLTNNALVLVADGRKMLFLRNQGDAGKMDLRVEDHKEQFNPANRNQSSDAAGRSFASVGNRRSAMEETDFHQLAEDRFAADAADLLRQRALNNDFQALVVIAPPHTLGELRKHYHKSVASRIVGELDKDLTGRPVDDIEAALTRSDESRLKARA